MLGIYWDDGKENGNYNLRFGVSGLGLPHFQALNPRLQINHKELEHLGGI